MPDCLVCSTSGADGETISFPTLRDLKAHTDAGHPRPPKQLPKDPRGDHPSLTEIKSGKVKSPVQPGGTTVPPVLPVPSVEQNAPLIPLELKYKWEGQCPKCRDHVRTIEMDLENMAVVVAFCVRCDKKLDQKEVIPLRKQSSKRIVEASLKLDEEERPLLRKK